MRSATTARRASVLAVALLAVIGRAAAQTDGLSFIAVGDAGQPGEAHRSTAMAVNRVAAELWPSGTSDGMLLFLGDNFYPNGLNDPGDAWIPLRDEILAPYMDLMRRLGSDNVRAIPGNHDYYCRNVNTIPYGYCNTGNERERAIDEWTYTYYHPSSARRAIAPGSRDSVEMIFFDSAYLLTRPTIFWRRPLDSLERLLRASAAAPGVRWRLFIAHHSTRTIGEHAGWRRWMSSVGRVGYVGNCLSDGDDPFRYVYEFFSTQDNCSERYRRYVDSLTAMLARTGTKIQALFGGHEHSLQLMHYPDSCAACPDVLVVSGAASKHDRVKSPRPPREFSHPLNDPANQGRSVPGFVVGRFREGRLELEFVDGRDGSSLDMGGGRRTFVVDEAGSLVDP